MNKVMECKEVFKTFGNKPVLNGVNLHLTQGSVMGLLGKNGAGKSTLLQLAVGMLKRDGGEFTLFGEDCWDLPASIKQKIGYVAQNSDAFYWMTAGELLDYTGAFYPHWDKFYTAQLAKKWDLPLATKAHSLSHGQKQILAIIQAMGHRPELLLLDEPVASLDAKTRRDFIGELVDINCELGCSVLFSTHITSDIERVAADVAILQNGIIRYQGELDNVKQTMVKIGLYGPIDPNQLVYLPNAENIQQSADGTTAFVSDFDPQAYQQIASDMQVELTVQPLALEDIFVELHK